MTMEERPFGPADREFWQGRWKTGQTGWDQGTPHPKLSSLFKEAQDAGLAPVGCRVLEPGCGRAHNGAAIAGLGYEVTAFDAIEEAIAAAKTTYASVEHLDLQVADALMMREEWRGQFHIIFDRAVLCALPPDLRRTYLRNCFDYLAPGGAFLSMPFLEVEKAGRSGPPFAIPMDALAALLTPGFALVGASEARVDDGHVIREMYGVWRRRSRYLVESV